MHDIEGYQEAVAKVTAMLEKPDGWMTPSGDDAEKDFEDWFEAETSGWEDTCHFQTLYGSTISDMARDLADENGLDGEAWLDIYLDLKNEFWEAWADKHDAYEHWQNLHTKE